MPIIHSTLIDNDSLLKIGIDNQWMADDFAHTFDSLNRLYSYYHLLLQALEIYENMGEKYKWHKGMTNLPDFFSLTNDFKDKSLHIFQSSNPHNHFLYSRSFELEMDFSLQVHKLKFGSKGSIDLIGIGKVFEIIKDLIIHYIPNKEKKIDVLLKEKEIEEKEQKIIQMKISNLKNLGLNSDDIMTLIGFESLHSAKLRELIERHKINNVKIEKSKNS